jgi:hypothetical protein
VFLARLIGLYCLLVALTFSAHKQETLMALDAIVHSQDILLFVGIVALVAGLALVIGHNIWKGGLATVLVTLVGWVLTVRAVLILLLPPDVMGFIWDMVRVDRLFYVYMAITAVIGSYLTWASFAAPKQSAPAAQ